MRKFFLVLFFLLTTISLIAQDKIPKEEFISYVRKNLLNHSWMKLKGNIFFRSKNDDIIKKKITLKAQILPQELIFEINIDDKEKIRTHQKFGEIYQSKELINNLTPENSFKQMGLNIADISLSFIYWDLTLEKPSERIGLHKCRVFLMHNPDNINYAKVYILEKYLSPIKVEWFTQLNKPPYQKLEFKAFTEKNNIWAPKKIYLTNKKGKINIKIEQVNAGQGQAKNLFE